MEEVEERVGDDVLDVPRVESGTEDGSMLY